MMRLTSCSSPLSGSDSWGEASSTVGLQGIVGIGCVALASGKPAFAPVDDWPCWSVLSLRDMSVVMPGGWFSVMGISVSPGIPPGGAESPSLGTLFSTVGVLLMECEEGWVEDVPDLLFALVDILVDMAGWMAQMLFGCNGKGKVSS